MPLGTLARQESPEPNMWMPLNYNEYIVYDPKQVAIRYLVIF